MAEKFTQLSAALSKLSSGSYRASIGATFRSKGLQELEEDLAATVDLLRNRLSNLAKTVADQLSVRVAERAVNSFDVGIMHAVTEKGIWRQDEQEAAFRSVVQAIRGARIMGEGRAGFASRRELDSIKLNTETAKSRVARTDQALSGKEIGKPEFINSNSEFNLMWMIAEFGTGIYARPNIREDGPSKLPGGAWLRSPKGPIILGQKGGHFLFPTRQNLEDARSDLNFAGITTQNIVYDYLRGRRGRI